MSRLTLAALVLAVAPRWAGAEDPKKPNYFPLAKGNKWEYRHTKGSEKSDAVIEVKEVETKDGKTSAVLKSDLDGMTFDDRVAVGAKGVVRETIQGNQLNPPLVMLKYPVKAGEKWEQTVKAAGIALKFTSEAKDAGEVKVPAGTYKAVRVETILEVEGSRIEIGSWYADGVGLIKQTVTTDDGANTVASMELTKFTPGK